MPKPAWRVLQWLRYWPDVLGLAGACAIGRGLWLVHPSLAWIAGGALAIRVALRGPLSAGSSS